MTKYTSSYTHKLWLRQAIHSVSRYFFSSKTNWDLTKCFLFLILSRKSSFPTVYQFFQYPDPSGKNTYRNRDEAVFTFPWIKEKTKWGEKGWREKRQGKEKKEGIWGRIRERNSKKLWKRTVLKLQINTHSQSYKKWVYEIIFP